MSRPIKFRVWNKVSKEFTFFGTPILSLDKKENCPLTFLRPSGENIKVMISGYGELEQFTGLNDKNGKDLDWWEGDLLADGGKIMEIVYRDGCFWAEWVKYPENQTALHVIAAWAEHIKKIGNAHEKPELKGAIEC